LRQTDGGGKQAVVSPQWPLPGIAPGTARWVRSNHVPP
jgi:hypothetical protein